MPLARQAGVVAADLRDDSRLASLYVEAVRRGYWPNGQQAALDFFALAEKALNDDTLGTPGKLFYSLVKAKRTDRISNGLEARAQSRLPSAERWELVRRGEEIQPAGSAMERQLDRDEGLDDLFGRDIGFSHAILMQCFLPQKALPAGERLWVSRHGRASLEVEAGRMAVNKVGRSRACGVPAGAKPRLILPYIVREAIAQESRNIDLGRSLRNFMAERLGIPVSGANGKALVKAIEDVGMASFYLGTWGGCGYGTSVTRVASAITVWAERDPRQESIWNPEMVLSADFFEAIQEHRVPVMRTRSISSSVS